MSDEPTTMDYLLHETGGHTQGDWLGTTRKGTWVVYTQDGGDVATVNDYEDACLIAAAPKFREEILRLRAEVERLRMSRYHVDDTTSKYLSFALGLFTDEQDCEYTHFVGGFCTHDCCPHGGEEE